MKDRLIPCIYYVCANAECQKGKKDVTMATCKNCQKYFPRKTGNKKMETIKSKREKVITKDLKKYQKEF